MVASLTYRTADFTRWGGGQGSNLSATQVDLNFWTLFEAIQAIQSEPDNFAGIDFITVMAGDQLYITLTDHRVMGPFTLPTSEWNPRGVWQPNTAYAPFDVVTFNGSLYLITIGHTSAATFSPFATDGNGHNLYNLILNSPDNVLPLNGSLGQRLVRQTGSPLATSWEYDRIRMYVFIAGQPDPGGLYLQYPVGDFMSLPQGLAGSVFYAHNSSIAPTTYTLSIIRDGAPFAIGTITFNVSPPDVTVAFPSQVNLEPGDIVTLTAPGLPDAAQANISFLLIANLTS